MNAVIKAAGRVQSNQTRELAATMYALQNTPKVVPLRIISDSRDSIDGIIKRVEIWESNGWTKTHNSDLRR